jgi:hypothetical protein
MKKQIISLCALALFTLSACNKSETPAPCVYGGTCDEPDQQNMLSNRKPKPEQKSTAADASALSTASKNDKAYLYRNTERRGGDTPVDTNIQLHPAIPNWGVDTLVPHL